MCENSVSEPRRLYGILGLPLAQSLSPFLHGASFQMLDHAGVYFRWEKKVHELPDFFRAMRTLPIAGLSVTVPYKEAVASFLDGISERAQKVGAVNTIFWHGAKLMGDNTDVAGFLATVARLPRTLPRRALVLGSGGAARAVLAGLNESGVGKVVVSARNREKAQTLASHFSCEQLPWEDREAWLVAQDGALVVNATPLGMKGKLEGASPLHEDCFARMAAGSGGADSFLAYDVVYNPQITPFLSYAARHGLGWIDGVAFFAAQAAAQQELWLGAHVDEKELADMAVRLLRK